MKSNLKTLFYAICSITALSLLTACGGGSSDSKSGSNSEFLGNWKSQCYSGQKLDDIAKEIGVSIVDPIKSLEIKLNNTADTTAMYAYAYSDTACSASIFKRGGICRYSNQGEKMASDGKTVKKIIATCDDGDTLKDIYLIENGNLYFSAKGTKDSDGYPNELFYDHYFIKQ